MQLSENGGKLVDDYTVWLHESHKALEDTKENQLQSEGPFHCYRTQGMRVRSTTDP